MNENLTEPLAFRWLKAHNFVLLKPWSFMSDKEEIESMRKEYHRESGKEIYPFARRYDNDQIAGFELMDNQIYSRVLTVTLNYAEKKSNPSYEVSDDLLAWIQDVMIHNTRAWMTEEDLEDMV